METANNKPPLLFIPGFRGTHEGLVDVAVWMTDRGYECYYPDVPPFGQNIEPLESYDEKTYAKFIADYIKEHKLKNPVLIGHSMGSLVAAATAAKYPKRVNDKLVLLSPISVKPPKPIAMLQPLVTLLPNKVVGFITTKYMLIKKKDHNAVRDILEVTYRCGANYTSRKDVRASARFSAGHRLSDFNFKKDTLLIAGEKDRLISRKKTEKYVAETTEKYEKSKAKSAANAKIKAEFIKGAGHLINYEEPRRVAELISDFLKK